MKRLFVMLALLTATIAVMAQNNMKEYISAFVTFNEVRCPQDSLDNYGIKIQTDMTTMATMLIPADRYEAFVASNLVARVQPATRITVGDGVNITRAYNTPMPQVAKAPATAAEPQIDPRHHKDHKCDGHHHHGHKCDSTCRDARKEMIPVKEIEDDEARGAYVGLLLGGSRNHMAVASAPESGDWYERGGLSLDVRAGYQFNRWFGIRSGLTLISKSYATDLLVPSYSNTEALGTVHTNQYLQLPVMADFGLGNETVRLHLMAGGYAGLWLSQYRDGYIYSPSGTTGWGWKRGFEADLDNRFDAGLAGALGLTVRINAHWQMMFEGNYYHSLTSVILDPYKMKNRTWTFGLGMTYHF